MENVRNKFLKAALWYRKRGLSVIPCKPKSKEALVPWTQYQKQLPTEQQVRMWWTQNPDANIAIVLGRVSNIITLEVDDGKAINGYKIPVTPQAKSGGKGLPHIYFQYVEGMRNYKAHENGRELFSIRGNGQYVLAPPSLHPSGNPYRWANNLGIHEVPTADPPAWVLDFITQNLEKEDSQSQEIFNQRSESVWRLKREKIIEVICKNWVEGQRQELALCLAGFLAKQGMPWPETNNLILEIATLCGDGETQQRMGAIKATFAKVQNGQMVKGYTGLERMLGAEDLQAFSSLFDPSRAQVLEQLEKIPWPQPLAEAAFHGLAGQFVKAIAPQTEADRAALLLEFLTAFGSVIGPRPYFRVEADEHRMRLNVTLVGESSKARKGTSWGHVWRLFETVDPDWAGNIQSGLSSGEGLIWAVRNEITKREPIKEGKRVVGYEDLITDPGVKDKRLLVFEAEFASTLRVLGREGNTLSAVIRNAWDRGHLQTLTKNSQAKATGAHVALITHITRQELLRYLTNTEAGNGFGNRFLWICVKRSRCLPFGGETHNIDFEPLVKQLSAAVNFASQVERIQWAEETRPLWEEIYPALSEGKPGLFGAMTARAEAYVTRLACIYALLDLSRLDPDNTDSGTLKAALKVEIMAEHLKAALAVWDYAEDSARYIFQTVTGDAMASEILSALMAAPGGMTRTAIYNYFSRHKSSEQISAALDTLEALGRARKEIIPTEGRSREVWFFDRSQGAPEAQKAQEE